MKPIHSPQVGAPDPELKNSPIFDRGDEDILSLDLELESGGCDFNAVRYPLGQYVQSGNELLHCVERGAVGAPGNRRLTPRSGAGWSRSSNG